MRYADCSVSFLVPDDRRPARLPTFRYQVRRWYTTRQGVYKYSTRYLVPKKIPRVSNNQRLRYVIKKTPAKIRPERASRAFQSTVGWISDVGCRMSDVGYRISDEITTI